MSNSIDYFEGKPYEEPSALDVGAAWLCFHALFSPFIVASKFSTLVRRFSTGLKETVNNILDKPDKIL